MKKSKIIIEKSELPITSKSGLYLLDFLFDQIDFNRTANRIFGALALDDVKGFQDDDGFKRMLNDPTIPSSDALGDWLYRQSQTTQKNKEDEKGKITDNPGEKKIMAFIGEHARLSIPQAPLS